MPNPKRRHSKTRTANRRTHDALKPIGGPVDVEGGWFDAGDYLKFVETTSYVDGVMQYADRTVGASFPGGSRELDAETAVGQQWIAKMWDAASGSIAVTSAPSEARTIAVAPTLQPSSSTSRP